MQKDSDMHKVAVFDFCETLADFQTANAFVDFVRQNVKSVEVRLVNTVYVVLSKLQVIRFLNFATSHKHSIGKNLKLLQLRGMSRETIEAMAQRFHEERIKPHLIEATVERMEQLKKDGYEVGLSSGGYGVYLKHFAQDYKLDFVQCSEIGFRNGRCTGRLAGADCMREEKVRRLTQRFGNGDNAVAFSDSLSDLPLLEWASQPVVVSRGKHQAWVEKYGFQEIIW